MMLPGIVNQVLIGHVGIVFVWLCNDMRIFTTKCEQIDDMKNIVSIVVSERHASTHGGIIEFVSGRGRIQHDP